MDGYLRYWPGYWLISFYFYFIWSSENEEALICSTSTGTWNQPILYGCFYLISFHSKLSVFLSHHFYGVCLLACAIRIGSFSRFIGVSGVLECSDFHTFHVALRKSPYFVKTKLHVKIVCFTRENYSVFTPLLVKFRPNLTRIIGGFNFCGRPHSLALTSPPQSIFVHIGPTPSTIYADVLFILTLKCAHNFSMVTNISNNNQFILMLIKTSDCNLFNNDEQNFWTEMKRML